MRNRRRAVGSCRWVRRERITHPATARAYLPTIRRLAGEAGGAAG
jgi:hypothetical protein